MDTITFNRNSQPSPKHGKLTIITGFNFLFLLPTLFSAAVVVTSPHDNWIHFLRVSAPYFVIAIVLYYIALLWSWSGRKMAIRANIALAAAVTCLLIIGNVSAISFWMSEHIDLAKLSPMEWLASSRGVQGILWFILNCWYFLRKAKVPGTRTED